MRARTFALLLCAGACRDEDVRPGPLDGSIDPTDAGADPPGPCEVDAGPVYREPVLEPFCCTPELCAFHISACNPETCRCERVPCEEEGAPCDPALLPGVTGEIVCGARPGGLYCTTLIRDGDTSDCPVGGGLCYDGDHEPCLCGGECVYFADDCPGQTSCALQESPAPFGICEQAGGPGRGGEGAPCQDGLPCEPGLACKALTPWSEYRCVRLDCGLQEGAPGCDAGERCETVDPQHQIGVCGLACSSFDEGGPCGPTETCQWRGLPALAHGVCRQASDHRLPDRGATCQARCRQGSTCQDGVCLEACDPGARSPAEEGACAAGADCTPTSYEYPLGFCADRCDPWSRSTDSCPAGSYCAFEVDACGNAIGHCRVVPGQLGRAGEDCWPACAQNLRCAFDECRPVCLVGAAAQDPLGCPEPDRCDIVEPASLSPDHGVCIRPCVPGRNECEVGQWCQPTELDRDSGEWRGVCL